MKKNKLSILLLVPILLTGCGNAKHTKPVKKVDYLYEISYDKYDWKTAKNSLLKLPEGQLEGFGCSSARNGNFYGRSFDFTFNHMSEFVVRSTAGKYKNIGIAIANTETTPEMVENGLSKDQYNVLPYSVVDGINEMGVVCNANVVPVCDLVAAGEKRTEGTNPGKEDYFYQFLCRYILDNASSALEAVNMIQQNINVTNKINGNICDYYTLNKGGFELHYMIADKDNTYIVEFINNEIKVIQNNSIKGATAMTNYYLSIDLTLNACGVERRQILLDNLGEATSVEGMAHLMERVRYTNSVREKDNPWWTDVKTHDETIEHIKAMKENYPDDFSNILDAGLELINENKRNGETKTITTSIPGAESYTVAAPWISTHMSVYDIENKTLRLVTQEQYERVMNYEL